MGAQVQAPAPGKMQQRALQCWFAEMLREGAADVAGDCIGLGADAAASSDCFQAGRRPLSTSSSASSPSGSDSQSSTPNEISTSSDMRVSAKRGARACGWSNASQASSQEEARRTRRNQRLRKNRVETNYDRTAGRLLAANVCDQAMRLLSTAQAAE